MDNTLYIVWTEKNNVGIAIIDEQHKAIVSIINSLYYFIKGKHGFEILKPVLNMLDQYIDIHFKTKEELMAKAEYPMFEEHKRLHEKLVNRTKDISSESVLYKDAGMVLKFLKDWWLGHINKEDQKYAPFIKKLIKPEP